MNLTATAYETLLRTNPDLAGPPLPKPRRGQAPTEHEEQSAVIRWAAATTGVRPELRLLFAIPNGGMRDKRTAAMLAAEGVRAGVPDLFLPVARQGAFGLWLELKRADRSNHPTPEQCAWVSALRAEGYRAVVCYGAAEAIAALTDYLGERAE